MGKLFDVSAAWLASVSIGVSLILIVVVVVLWTKISAMRRRYEQMLNGGKNDNLEDVLIGIQYKMNEQKAESQATSAKVSEIAERLKKMKANVGIHRYNAFSDNGNDLSFTVAILDEFQDGVVLTGIHSREQTYLYAKPVQRGQSSYSLSPEEKESINQALTRQ